MVAFLDRITGKNKLNKEQKIYTKYRLADQPYDIGDHTYGLPRIMRWDDKTKLHIGKFCSIAEDVTIILGGNHRSDWVTTYPFNVINLFFPNAVGIEGHPATKGDITIGNDVWIGNGATILSGITIGDGAIIGARAVVASDVPPYSIVVGNPAQVIRKRFDDESIQALLKIKWWNWDEEKINREVVYLCSNDIRQFIKRNTTEQEQ